jgi:sec-independent protein translocase protein TatB
MFDIGFLELIIVGIIGLIVLGPERLPVAARTLGRWIGRARRMAGQFTKEIDRQVEIEELKAELKKQGESLDINDDVEKIRSTVSAALKDVEEFEPLPRSHTDDPFISPKPVQTQAESPDPENSTPLPANTDESALPSSQAQPLQSNKPS